MDVYPYDQYSIEILDLKPALKEFKVRLKNYNSDMLYYIEKVKQAIESTEVVNHPCSTDHLRYIDMEDLKSKKRYYNGESIFEVILFFCNELELRTNFYINVSEISHRYLKCDEITKY